jgi:hypothetical protein
LLDENIVNLAAVGFGDSLGLGQLFWADDSASNEKFTQICHGVSPGEVLFRKVIRALCRRRLQRSARRALLRV